MTQNPCKACENRSADCHCNCSEYKEWVTLRAQELAMRRKNLPYRNTRARDKYFRNHLKRR